MKKSLFLILFIVISCQTKNERKFLFDETKFRHDSLKVKFYNEYDPKKYFFTIKDSLIIRKIFQSISKHSERDYVEFMPTNYADSFFDFKVTQNEEKFLISTGNIKEPKKERKHFVYIFRKEKIGYVPEGRFYCDTIFKILKRYKKIKRNSKEI